MTGLAIRTRTCARNAEPGQRPCSPHNVYTVPGGEQGLTLIETLLAAAILAIGIFGVISMVSFSTVLEGQARHITHASLIFEEVLEHMVHLQSDPDGLSDMVAPSGIVSRDGTTYDVRCSIEDGKPLSGCREISCQILWKYNGKQSGAEHAYTFCTQ